MRKSASSHIGYTTEYPGELRESGERPDQYLWELGFASGYPLYVANILVSACLRLIRGWLLDTQNLVNASGGRLYWFTVGGNNVTITGSEDAKTGWINGYGEAWWKAGPYSYPLSES